MERNLTPDRIELLAKEFAAQPTYRVMQNAVTMTPVRSIALDRSILTGIDHSVSHLLDDWKPTDQEHSGRCWMFAGTNLLRAGASKQLEVKDFEFSQSYVMFWDKLEKANYFLEGIIETADRDIDDRTVAHLLSTPCDDGGQWNMFVALVRKHGLVPKVAMPETDSSSNSSQMNNSLCKLLRQAARDVRALRSEGMEAMRQKKAEILSVVHRLLCIHLGTPPERFLWQWADKERGFHREGLMTPQEFAEKYVTIPLDDYVCVVHDPRETSPTGRTFTVEYLGNVVDAPPVIYLNVEIDLIKRLAMQTVMDGEPVWFGCDVGQMMANDQGVWDAELYDLGSIYDTRFDLSKAERLTHHETFMTHAMLFTGVDVVDDAPRRWRVENSWGDKKADQGFHTMNDSWFAEYVFEIAVRKDRLPEDLRARLDDPPIVLPAWDPMGALATGA